MFLLAVFASLNKWDGDILPYLECLVSRCPQECNSMCTLTLWTQVAYSADSLRSLEIGQWRCSALSKEMRGDTDIYNLVSKAKQIKGGFHGRTPSKRPSVETSPTNEHSTCQEPYDTLLVFYVEYAVPPLKLFLFVSKLYEAQNNLYQLVKTVRVED